MSLDTNLIDCCNKAEQGFVVGTVPQLNHTEIADALVSVYIPTKNRLPLLQRAVQSVLCQSYSNIELIVADDGSTDGTRAYLTSLAEAGMAKVVFMPTSGGACAARNAAIKIASGEFLTGLDDDDFFMPDRIRLFMNQWIDLIRSGDEKKIAGLFDSILFLRSDLKEKGRTVKWVSVDDLTISNSYITQIFAPKRYFVDAGLFDPGMPMWQDWDLWLRIAQRYGSFMGICKRTYVMDIGHNGPRISLNSEFVVRKTAYIFGEKHMSFRPLRRFGLRANFMRYENINLRFWEIIGLLLIGYYKPIAGYALRRMVGINRYRMFKKYCLKISWRSKVDM